MNRTEQRVLTVPAERVKSLYTRACFHSDREKMSYVDRVIKTTGAFVSRDRAESDPSIVQIIAYGLLRYRSSILCIRRAQNSNRSVLRLKYTVLFGGHVDDVRSVKPIESCIRREIDEELGVQASPSRIRPLGIVTDPTTIVGRLHMGIVFDIEHDTDSVEFSRHLDTAEFVGQGKRKLYQFKTLPELCKLQPDFDPWSELFLSSDSAIALLGSSPSAQQESLDLDWRAW